MSSGHWESQTSENEVGHTNFSDDAHLPGEDCSPVVDVTDEREEIVRQLETAELQNTNYSVVFVRTLALLCACSLSIGSHYATYILGPIKTRLSREMGTSNTEFSLLISALSLNSTWTPLVGGVLASRLGTTITSIMATGLICLGQLTLLVGDMIASVRLMTLGLFIFGLGVSPLAVVQESIIVRFFKNHGLGLSLAFGLVVGKASSFVAARTSYPLSEAYGSRAPFYAASALATLSFAMNLIYLAASKWLIRSSGTELEAPELDWEARQREVESFSEAAALKHVAEKRKVLVRDITKLGDVFWAYIGINVLCGMIWHPFAHLAPSIIEKRFHLTELDASTKASYLLAGSTILYPICGFVVDRLKRGPILHILLLVSSALTMLCYIWMSLPPSFTGTPMPAIVTYGVGFGFAPLLLVVIVPTLVPLKYVPTTLGAHKSLEQVGTTSFQTFAGLLLDSSREAAAAGPPSEGEDKSIQALLLLFLSVNVLQMVGLIGLWWLDRSRKAQAARRSSSARVENLDENARPPSSPSRHRRQKSTSTHKEPESVALSSRRSVGGPSGTQLSSELDYPEVVSGSYEQEEEEPLLITHSRTTSDNVTSPRLASSESQLGETKSLVLARSTKEVQRGNIFAIISLCLIGLTWLLFLGTAFLKLRSKKERTGGSPFTM